MKLYSFAPRLCTLFPFYVSLGYSRVSLAHLDAQDVFTLTTSLAQNGKSRAEYMHNITRSGRNLPHRFLPLDYTLKCNSPFLSDMIFSHPEQDFLLRWNLRYIFIIMHRYSCRLQFTSEYCYCFIITAHLNAPAFKEPRNRTHAYTSNAYEINGLYIIQLLVHFNFFSFPKKGSFIRTVLDFILKLLFTLSHSPISFTFHLLPSKSISKFPLPLFHLLV